MSLSRSRNCVTVNPETELFRNAAMSCDEKPRRRALSWSMTRRITLEGSSQSNWTSTVSGSVAHDRGDLAAMAHLADVLAGDAELHRKADRRSVLQPRDAAAQRREVALEALEQARAQAFALRIAGGDQHELREVRLLELLVERQVEARAARADVRDEALDARLVVEDRLQLLRLRERRGERAAFGQPQVDQQFGRDDEGKNCCGTKRNAAIAAAKTTSVARGRRTAARRRRRPTRAAAVERRPVDRVGIARIVARRGRGQRAP